MRRILIKFEEMRKLLKKWLTKHKRCPVCRTQNRLEEHFCSQCRVSLLTMREEIPIPPPIELPLKASTDDLQNTVTLNVPNFAQQLPYYKVDLDVQDFDLDNGLLVKEQNLLMPKLAIASTETIINGMAPFPVIGSGKKSAE